MTLSLIHRFVFSVFSVLAVASTSACIQADELGQAVRAAVQSTDASVVRLRVIGGEQSVDGDKVSSLVTTGVVISDAGEILTSEFARANPKQFWQKTSLENARTSKSSRPTIFDVLCS